MDAFWAKLDWKAYALYAAGKITHGSSGRVKTSVEEPVKAEKPTKVDT